MCVHTNARRVDPTRTVLVRRNFERELVRRFKRVKAAIRKSIVEDNDLVLNARFDFPRSEQKVSAFMDWIREMVSRDVLEVSYGTPVERAASQHWTNVYLRSAYQKGLEHAASQIRKGGGTVAQEWVDSGFYRPVHADRAGLIYTRTYSDLKGVTDAMDSQISSVLAQGIIEGRGVQQIARMLTDRVDKIGITRARVIARTEVIRAHAEATLNSYEEAGVAGVQVQAEFTTAQDNAVCRKCKALEGKKYPIEKAHGIIPVHPNCRCAFLPIVEAQGIELR